MIISVNIQNVKHNHPNVFPLLNTNKVPGRCGGGGKKIVKFFDNQFFSRTRFPANNFTDDKIFGWKKFK